MEKNTKEVKSVKNSADLDSKELKIDKKMWLNSLKMTGKILLCVIFVFFYMITTLFFIAPNFDAKIFNFFGFKNAEESCYLKQYENSGELSDLYNLVLFEQKQENYQEELYYINVLMRDKNYDEFCDRLDVSGIYNAGSKSMYVYVGDVNAYLVNRKIKGLYALNLGYRAEIIKSLKSGALTEYALATFVDLVKNDSITQGSKKSAYVELMTRKEGESASITELLDDRIDLIEAKLEEERVSGTVEEILLQYALVKLNYAGYTLYKTAELDASKTVKYEQAYEQAAQAYASLI